MNLAEQASCADASSFLSRSGRWASDCTHRGALDSAQERVDRASNRVSTSLHDITLEVPKIVLNRDNNRADEVELTVLMPCLNEAETLARCIDKASTYLTRSGVNGEVLVADNGSTDGSQAIAAAHGARVVNIPTRGYGAALIGGINAARGHYVIMGDSDDSYDFSNLDGFVAQLRDGF